MLRNLMILVVIAVVGRGSAAMAQDQTAYRADSMIVDGARCATVSRLGVHLFGIPVGAGGMSMDERAQVIADSRLNALCDKGVLSVPDALQVGRMGGEVVIYVDNPKNVGGLGTRTLILTIDTNYERFLGAGRCDIAYFWRDLMRLWSSVGIMKRYGEVRDPAGRLLNADDTWHHIPRGYSARYGR